MRARIIAVSLLYLAAIVAANLIATHYIAAGHPEVTIYTALGLIAFDYVARDLLHDWTDGRQRVASIAALVAAGSLLSYILNADAELVAKGSAAAFAAAMTVDSLVYQSRRYRPWLERSNASNIAGAIVDSIVFCWIVGLPVSVAVGQAVAKVAGGVVFSIALQRYARRRLTPDYAHNVRTGAQSRHG